MAYSLSFADNNNNNIKQQSLFSLSSMVEPSALMQQQLEFSQDQLRYSSSPRHIKSNTNANANTASSNNKHDADLNQKNDYYYNHNNHHHSPNKEVFVDRKNNNNHNTTTKGCSTAALPKTLKEIKRQKSRAIVVTETTKPFRVVDVNKCWEGLCGYTLKEARGKTLGSLLKGPATNQVAATGLISQLLQGCQEAGTVLINYTKEGREFRNRIRVGPVYYDDDYDDDEKQHDGTNKNNITHFVGVLEEIQEE